VEIAILLRDGGKKLIVVMQVVVMLLQVEDLVSVGNKYLKMWMDPHAVSLAQE